MLIIRTDYVKVFEFNGDTRPIQAWLDKLQVNITTLSISKEYDELTISEMGEPVVTAYTGEYVLFNPDGTVYDVLQHEDELRLVGQVIDSNIV